MHKHSILLLMIIIRDVTQVLKLESYRQFSPVSDRSIVVDAAAFGISVLLMLWQTTNLTMALLCYIQVAFQLTFEAVAPRERRTAFQVLPDHGGT